MNGTVYFDTSALAKWYLNEARSDAVEAYLVEAGPVAISDLTVVEMRSLLARRRREEEIDPLLESEIFSVFQADVRRGSLLRHPLPPEWAAGAVDLLAALPLVPLRTLDAIHLLVAQEIGAGTVATADRVMAAGAEAAGLAVVRFHPEP